MVQVVAPAALVEPAGLQPSGGWAREACQHINGSHVRPWHVLACTSQPSSSCSTAAQLTAHQASHAVLAVLGLVLAGQVLQVSKPAWDWNSPAGQFSHAVCAALAKVPAPPVATEAKSQSPVAARTVQACKHPMNINT